MTPSSPARHPAASNTGQSTAGQTMIFMIMALLILAVVIIWVFDVHTVLQLKARTQNAGDAAALAAARWQGISLNLVGDLNILQALALSRGDSNACAQIAAVQARLCFVGPMVGLLASQQAAKNNRAYSNPDFTSNLMAHANRVRSDYAIFFPEPYPDAWQEYGDMLADIASQGVAAGPDNTSYFAAPYTVPPRNFYEAVAGLDWCWFYWHDLNLLQTYSSYLDWPEPPTNPPPNPHNSEVFGLGLNTNTTMLPGGVSAVGRMNLLRSERRISPDNPGTISNEIAGITNTWYVYDGYDWGSWSILANDDFPIRPLHVKPEYDYSGADAVIRVEATADHRMPAAFPGLQPFLTHASPSAALLTQTTAVAGAVTWTAASKPFGYLTTDGSPVRPDAYALVLPAFHNVRLIPVDAASGANLGTYDMDWYKHNEEHMPLYRQNGVAGLEAGCWYCQQLLTWEDPAFRQQGIAWLSDTNHTCEHAVSRGPGGGTRRGH